MRLRRLSHLTTQLQAIRSSGCSEVPPVHLQALKRLTVSLRLLKKVRVSSSTFVTQRSVPNRPTHNNFVRGVMRPIRSMHFPQTLAGTGSQGLPLAADSTASVMLRFPKRATLGESPRSANQVVNMREFLG